MSKSAFQVKDGRDKRGSHWSSILPPSRLHGCRRTASPAPPSLSGVSGECSFTSRETPEGSLTSSRSVAIEVPQKAVKRSSSALVGRRSATTTCWRIRTPSSSLPPRDYAWIPKTFVTRSFRLTTIYLNSSSCWKGCWINRLTTAGTCHIKPQT